MIKNKMRKGINLFFILMIAVFIVQGCSSGKKAYEKGNYYEAVMKSVDRLRSKPGNKKAIHTLRNSYPLAVQFLQEDAENRLESDDPRKWTSVVTNYTKINNMYEEIRRSPGALKVIPDPVSMFDEMADAKNRAAEEMYSSGLRAYDEGTRESGRQAYQFFVQADKFVPGYKDVKNKIEESRDLATYKIILDQIPAVTRYRISSDFFQNKIESYLKNNIRNEFVRFYTPEEAERVEIPDADQILHMYFEDFVVGEVYLKESTKEVWSKDSVKVGEVELENGKKVEAYNKVSADLTVYRKEIKSRGTMMMQIFDAKTNGLLHTDKFSGEYVWFSEWGSFNGDERALDASQKKIVRAKEVPPPPNKDLFLEFTKPIYNQVTSSLGRYYSRF